MAGKPATAAAAVAVPAILTTSRRVILSVFDISRVLLDGLLTASRYHTSGTSYEVGHQQPECIHQDVALAPFHALVPVEAARATALRGLHRLAGHDHYTRRRRASCRDTRLCIDGAVQLQPD